MELVPGLPDDIAKECLIRLPYKHFRDASLVNKGWKSDFESKEFHKKRKESGLSQDIIVFTQAEPNPETTTTSSRNDHRASIVYQFTTYEPETGVWDQLSPIPEYTNGLPLFCRSVGVGCSLVVIGGWEQSTWKALNTVHVYDFVSATWKKGANMPGPSRSLFACASGSEDQMVFVAGGHDEDKNALRSALAYDVIQDKWIQLADMAIERDECKGIFQGGKFHVIGGYSSNMQGLFEGSAEAFDVATWQWSQVIEDVLPKGIFPGNCVADDKGNIFSDQLALLGGSMSAPPVHVGMTTVTWQGSTMVIGSPEIGRPQHCYMLETGKWRKVKRPERFRGYVQSVCSLQI